LQTPEDEEFIEEPELETEETAEAAENLQTASTPVSLSRPSTAASTSSVHASGSRKRKATEEDKCLEAVKSYFTQKTQKTAVQSGAVSAKSDDDEDNRFGLMLAAELKQITVPSLKRDAKMKLVNTVLGAQADEEQLLLTLVVGQPQELASPPQPDAAVARTAVATTAEDQPCSSGQADAQLLMHFHLQEW